jgi:hypothetical protein
MRKMGARTVVVEELGRGCAEWDRVLQEIGALRARLGNGMQDPVVQKFTFVSRQVDVAEGVGKLPDESFLGYAVLVNLQTPGNVAVSYVLESVIRELCLPPPDDGGGYARRPLLNNFLHVKRTFQCNVAEGRQYPLPGSFFCQQNTITSVCAHACAAMVLNNTLDGMEMVTTEEVNRRLAIDHIRRKLRSGLAGVEWGTHEGLTPMELQAVFRGFGLEPYWMDFTGEGRAFYRDFLYGFVESGYPAVVAFTTSAPGREPAGHVVPVFGHTLNSDSWFPVAFAGYAAQAVGDKPYLSTVDWVADFLVHDDNLGMYFCLPGHSFRPEGHPDPGMMFTPIVGIGVYPQTMPVSLMGFEAERLACMRFCHFAMYLSAKGKAHLLDSYYMAHLLKHHFNPDERTAVFRVQLVTKDQYLGHLRKNDNAEMRLQDNERATIEGLLRAHSYFWLAEITEPDLYVGNKAKVLDILIDPATDLHQSDPQAGTYGVILARLPGALLVPEGEEWRDSRLSVEGHLPLFELTEHAPGTVW